MDNQIKYTVTIEYKGEILSSEETFGNPDVFDLKREGPYYMEDAINKIVGKAVIQSIKKHNEMKNG